MCSGFSLLFFWPSYQSVSDLFQSGAVSGLLVLSAAGVPGCLFPLRCFACRRVVSVTICSRFLLVWIVLSSVLFSGVPPSPSVRWPSLGWPSPSLSSPSLSFWSVLGGAAVQVFLLSRLLVVSRMPFVLSPCLLVFSYCW